jgi:hypothetical protein
MTSEKLFPSHKLNIIFKLGNTITTKNKEKIYKINSIALVVIFMPFFFSEMLGSKVKEKPFDIMLILPLICWAIEKIPSIFDPMAILIKYLSRKSYICIRIKERVIQPADL